MYSEGEVAGREGGPAWMKRRKKRGVPKSARRQWLGLVGLAAAAAHAQAGVASLRGRHAVRDQFMQIVQQKTTELQHGVEGGRREVGMSRSVRPGDLAWPMDTEPGCHALLLAAGRCNPPDAGTRRHRQGRTGAGHAAQGGQMRQHSRGRLTWG